MATAATAAKQNSNEWRGGERENKALLHPLGVFKVKWDVASQVGGSWSCVHPCMAPKPGLGLRKVPAPDHPQQSRAGS